MEIGGPPRICTWWPCASTSRRVRAGTSLPQFAAKRDTKAELNRRSQVCEALAGTGISRRVKWNPKRAESGARHGGRAEAPSTMPGLWRQAGFAWEMDGHEGSAPLFRFGRSLRTAINVYLSTLMPDEMARRAVAQRAKAGVPCGSRTRLRGFADHCLSCSANGTRFEIEARADDCVTRPRGD